MSHQPPLNPEYQFKDTVTYYHHVFFLVNLFAHVDQGFSMPNILEPPLPAFDFK